MSVPDGGFVPAPLGSPARRWWSFYPSPSAADLARLARLEVASWATFPWRPVRLDDNHLRSLLLDAQLNPGGCSCVVQDLRARIELAARDAA